MVINIMQMVQISGKESVLCARVESHKLLVLENIGTECITENDGVINFGVFLL